MADLLVVLEVDDERAAKRAMEIVEREDARDVDVLMPVSSRGLEHEERSVALACLIGFLFGASASYFIQWWINVIAYPIDVGGRPYHSAPAFIPLTFEGGVLCAALSVVGAFLWRARLPDVSDPIFALPSVERATRDRFVVSFIIESPRWERVRAALDDVAPLHIELTEVER